MKILYIGHLHENSGWGECGRNQVLAFAQKYDIVCRSIKFGGGYESPEIDELCKKNLDGVTHVIQYILPHMYVRFPNVKNIGFVELESQDISHSVWPLYMNIMDEMWVTNEFNRETLENSGVKVPTEIMGHPLDVSKVNNAYPSFNIPYLKGKFVFYTIAENNARKNLKQLIRCYHKAFDPTEPVGLLIKTNEDIGDLCNQVKRDAGLYKDASHYSQEVVIHDRISEGMIYGIHRQFDCFITTSKGESWQQPLGEAAMFGNPTIGPSEISMTDFISHKFKASAEEPCYGATQFSNYQNCNDYWNSYNDFDIIEQMRKVYESRKKEFRPLDLEKYSIESTNKRLEKLL